MSKSTAVDSVATWVLRLSRLCGALIRAIFLSITCSLRSSAAILRPPPHNTYLSAHVAPNVVVMAESVLDTQGVAVITGGASGFGLEAAMRCAAAKMSVAILDTNEEAMSTAAAAISEAGAPAAVSIFCDVSSWEACVAAADKIDARFANQRVTFLFNNAGIASGGADYSGTVLNGTQNDSGWRKVIDVNLFGVVNILRVFVPRFVGAGPLPSGKAVRVVTTSSVLGLYDGAMGLSPYNASKMACTAVCEMVYNELKSAGSGAAHVQTHSLHPSMAGTGLFGNNALSRLVENGVEGVAGGLSAADVIDSLFAQIVAGRFYCIVDDAKDVPAVEQIARRMQGQIDGIPTEATPMAMLGAFMDTRQEVRAEPVPAKANL